MPSPRDNELYVKRISLELRPKFHARMRELAHRKRVNIGLLYEQAIELYLKQPENYMGLNLEPIEAQPKIEPPQETTATVRTVRKVQQQSTTSAKKGN